MKNLGVSPIITAKALFVKKKCGSRKLPQRESALAEGLAVSALVCSGIHFVGTHQNLIQGTVVLVATVMGTLLDSAFNALVCVTVHKLCLL